MEVSKTNETRVRVRYAETDQMGVVYHANYLVWMEVGRVELCRSLGIRYRDLEAEGVLLAVVEVRCRFHSPARYDEEIIIRTSIADSNPRLVVFEYELREAEHGRILASGNTKHIFLSPALKPIKLPPKYQPLFALK